MPRPEERDLFDVLQEWGYEVCAVDPEDLPPSERDEILDLQKVAAELLKEDGVDHSPPHHSQVGGGEAAVAPPGEPLAADDGRRPGTRPPQGK